MIALHVIDALLQQATNDESLTVLFFFCNAQNEHFGTSAALLRGLMFQLIKRHPHLRNGGIRCLEEENYLQTLSSFGQLWKIFITMVDDAKVGDIVCVLDALDDCDETSRSELLKKLLAFIRDRPANSHSKFKLLGVSRNIASIHFRPDHLIPMKPSSSESTSSSITTYSNSRTLKASTKLQIMSAKYSWKMPRVPSCGLA
jgi:hypothetical protein